MILESGMSAPLPRRLLALLPLGIGLAGCNNYPVYLVAGYEQASFNNKADIVFVIDNSGSMRDNESALALNFDYFLGQLTSATGSNVPQSTLGDATTNYLRETTGDNAPIDYQLALTTTTIDFTKGPTTSLDPGEVGTLLGDPEVIRRDDADVDGVFKETLLCDTIYWNENELLSDPTYTPGDDGSCPEPTGDVVREYLDCVCGGDFNTSEGAGTEEGLEAAFDVLCRSVADPPDTCFDGNTAITEADILSNEGLLRDDAQTLFVIVTDEGDSSRRVASADEDPSVYLDLFEHFPNPTRFAVIGPAYHDQDGHCLDSADSWGVERYQTTARETGGTFIDLTELDDACTPLDWGENLTRLGELLQNLITEFPLAKVPDVSTIRAYIDGVEVPAAVETESCDASADSEDDGWIYDPSINAVKFQCDAVPSYNSDVKIYYKPLSGTPRSLPSTF